ncbi:hypothetical protein BDQ17DRAFT_1349410 [Cyathus striatus]|nr:hypothetical protein BDQ17DRAFT_1349410 [Cyathus striatus]
MTSPTSETHVAPVPSVTLESLAAAAERRARSNPQQLSAAQMAVEHEKRQKFRRMIDPGIVRPNSKEQAMASLQTLLTLSENLLRDPENPKFQQFKPTNALIKRNLMDPKGAIEYAIELGFRPEVRNFQPYYTFNKRHFEDLKIGVGILKDFISLENEKAMRAAHAKQNEKLVAEEAAKKVKLAYMDDRKTRMMRDEMEKQRRRDTENARQRSTTRSRSTSPTNTMPGLGQQLGPSDSDSPPSYEKIENISEQEE